jgi:hypothetical protein
VRCRNRTANNKPIYTGTRSAVYNQATGLGHPHLSPLAADSTG